MGTRLTWPRGPTKLTETTAEPSHPRRVSHRGIDILRTLHHAMDHHPHLRVEPCPTLTGRWLVAHCCDIIYVRPDQPVAELLDSLGAALTAYLPETTDELAARRNRRRG